MSAAAGRPPGAIVDRWLAPLAGTRLAALRILICGYATVWVAVRSTYWIDLSKLPDTRWHPVGLFAGWDGAPPSGAIIAVIAVALLAGLATVIGWGYRFVAPVFAVAVLVLTTFGSAWSQIFHTENLMVLHLVILAVVPAADRWSIDARRRSDGEVSPGSAHYGWPVRLMGAVTAVTYLVAGVAKLRIGGMAWLSGDALANHVAADNLRKILAGDTHSPIGGWLVARSWVFTPMAWASFIVELSAPFAVAFRRTRVWWVASAWLFHVGVLALMAILFPYQLLGIAFAPFFAIDEWLRRVRGAR